MNYNKTYSYVLPMLGNNTNDFYSLNGVYIRNDKYPEYTNHIFLVTEPVNNDYYTTYSNTTLKLIPGYVSDYTEPVNNNLVTIYELKHYEDIENYNYFMEGKYSKMSDTYKKHIIKFHKLQPGSNIIGVLYKLEYRYKQLEKKLSYHDDGTKLSPVIIPRDQEISDPPSIYDKEMLHNDIMINT